MPLTGTLRQQHFVISLGDTVDVHFSPGYAPRLVVKMPPPSEGSFSAMNRLMALRYFREQRPDFFEGVKRPHLAKIHLATLRGGIAKIQEQLTEPSDIQTAGNLLFSVQRTFEEGIVKLAGSPATILEIVSSVDGACVSFPPSPASGKTEITKFRLRLEETMAEYARGEYPSFSIERVRIAVGRMSARLDRFETAIDTHSRVGSIKQAAKLTNLHRPLVRDLIRGILPLEMTSRDVRHAGEVSKRAQPIDFSLVDPPKLAFFLGFALSRPLRLKHRTFRFRLQNEEVLKEIQGVITDASSGKIVAHRSKPKGGGNINAAKSQKDEWVVSSLDLLRQMRIITRDGTSLPWRLLATAETQRRFLEGFSLRAGAIHSRGMRFTSFRSKGVIWGVANLLSGLDVYPNFSVAGKRYLLDIMEPRDLARIEKLQIVGDPSAAKKLGDLVNSKDPANQGSAASNYFEWLRRQATTPKPSTAVLCAELSVKPHTLRNWARHYQSGGTNGSIPDAAKRFIRLRELRSEYEMPDTYLLADLVEKHRFPVEAAVRIAVLRSQSEVRKLIDTLTNRGIQPAEISEVFLVHADVVPEFLDRHQEEMLRSPEESSRRARFLQFALTVSVSGRTYDETVSLMFDKYRERFIAIGRRAGRRLPLHDAAFDLEDLDTPAMLAGLRALSRFDPAKFDNFELFAKFCVERAVKAEVYAKVEVKLTARRLAHRLRETDATLSALEVSQQFCVSEPTAAAALRIINAPKNVSLDAPLNEDGCDRHDLIEAKAESGLSLENAEILGMAMNALDASDQNLIRMRFEGGMSYVEIGAALGLQGDRIRQRCALAIKRMRERLDVLGETVR